MMTILHSWVRRKFNMSIQYTDVPTGDFRVALPQEADNELKSSMTASFQNNFEVAMNDVWTRLHKFLKECPSVWTTQITRPKRSFVIRWLLTSLTFDRAVACM